MATQMTQTQAKPSAELVFDTLNAYQRTAGLKAAIELDIFTAIGQGVNTVPKLAKRCEATERGVRILCDYLTIIGFLTKEGQEYALTPDSAMFLDRRSPACIASTAGFLALPEFLGNYQNLADAIRHGQAAFPGEGTISHENPIWVQFARSMAPLQRPKAEEVARLLNADAGEKWKVLDMAAGHGVFGIAIGKHNPKAEIYAQDWGPVLAVAADNAREAGIASRHHLVPGSAFDVDFGSGYDIILITNFLHHFAPATIETLLRKTRPALAPNGRAITVDFVPDENRLTPVRAAAFTMTMLGSTPAGDAYTWSEYERMFKNAGFSSNELHPSLDGQAVIVSRP
jgi:2-polyprenyl-3-methyl-5-hydroxy-6-metoxy-1,4-benzoquinol methylase